MVSSATVEQGRARLYESPVNELTIVVLAKGSVVQAKEGRLITGQSSDTCGQLVSYAWRESGSTCLISGVYVCVKVY